jgi:SAM-dependent methyltransferase
VPDADARAHEDGNERRVVTCRAVAPGRASPLYITLVSPEVNEQPKNVGADGGWSESADAWITAVERDWARVMLDPIMLRLAGDVRGARVLDIGCGEGRFSRKLARQGATCTGIDPTALLLRTALARGSIAPVRAVAEALPFAAASFDLAVTYITLVDIEHYREAIAEMARVLRPGGRLLAANIGFVSASQGENGGWRRDDNGDRLYVPIDHYAAESSAVYEWAGLRLRNYHRPLSAYMGAYLGAALQLREFLEPVPDEQWRSVPDFSGAFRVPWFNVMLWEKQ